MSALNPATLDEQSSSSASTLPAQRATKAAVVPFILGIISSELTASLAAATIQATGEPLTDQLRDAMFNALAAAPVGSQGFFIHDQVKVTPPKRYPDRIATRGIDIADRPQYGHFYSDIKEASTGKRVRATVAYWPDEEKSLLWGALSICHPGDESKGIPPDVFHKQDGRQKAFDRLDDVIADPTLLDTQTRFHFQVNGGNLISDLYNGLRDNVLGKSEAFARVEAALNSLKFSDLLNSTIQEAAHEAAYRCVNFKPWPKQSHEGQAEETYAANLKSLYDDIFNCGWKAYLTVRAPRVKPPAEVVEIHDEVQVSIEPAPEPTPEPVPEVPAPATE